MTVNSIKDIWNAVCNECKSKISEIAFDTFFKYLKPESISGEEFVLSASNDYIKGMIQSVYSEIINEAIEMAKKYSTEKSYSFINGVLKAVTEGVYGN